MKTILLSFLLFLSLSAFSQSPSEDYLGSWYTFGGSLRITENFSLTPYGEIRFYEPSSNYNLLFLSLRGNYHLKNNQTLGLGYAFLDIDTVFEFDKEPNVYEHRVFEQFTYSHKFGKFSISHRARLEHRFLEFSNRNELQNRFRYRLGLKYDVNSTFFAVLTEEPFVNFQDQVFHENRLFIGMGVHVSEKFQLQLGYLKQHIRKNNLNRIQIGINFQADFREPKIE